MSPDDRRLEAAVALGIITAAQAEAISAIAPAREDEHRTPRAFNAATLAYVLGAITVAGAMAWFLGDRWEWLGAGGVLATCVLYAVIFLVTARVLRREGYATAAGFAVLLAVATVPPTVIALNELFHWFIPVPVMACRTTDFDFWACRGLELTVELATAAATLIALRRVRFSLLVLPLAGLSVRMIFHAADALGANTMGNIGQGWVWVMGASVLAAAAYLTDRAQRGDEDFALWLHVAAVVCAVPATLLLLDATEWHRHLLIPGAFVAFAVALTLRRFVWLLLGMGWFVGYVIWLAAEVFRDSPAFPILLAGLGIAVIIATVWVQRHADQLVKRFGTVTSDGRPRFPGGVGLLLAPFVLAIVMLPGALREDEVRRGEERWRSQWLAERARREQTAAAASRERAGQRGPRTVADSAARETSSPRKP